jgi:hypothetical protein
MFNSSRRRINVMFTKDGIHTLVNIVIANPMWANLLPRTYTIQRFVASNVAQAPKRRYCDQHPINQFLPLVIEVFGYLHKQADVFYTIMPTHLELEMPEGLHLSVLVTFLHQKVSVELQRMQTSSILSWMIAIGLIISHLPPLHDTLPIIMANLS